MDEDGASREELALLSLHDLLTSVSSGHDLRVVLQKVAQGVVDALGFDMAAVNYLDDDGFLDVLGIAGDPDAIETMSGRRVPMADYLEEFELADDWGSLKFVPHERLPADVLSSWVPQLKPLDLPDAWHPMDALYAPLRGPDGELVGVLGVDLPRDGRRPSELKRQVLEMYAVQAGLAIHLARTRERELRIIEELREMATYRDEVNLALTHELKNPLTAILGHTELLGEALAEHGGSSASVKSVATAVQRMQDLIGNLLVLGRVQHEHPALPDAHVDLGELVHEAADLLAMQARQGGVRVETRADTPGPLVRGDRDELVMIVTNLMSNAIKFTPDGGHVSLTLDTGDTGDAPRARRARRVRRARCCSPAATPASASRWPTRPRSSTPSPARPPPRPGPSRAAGSASRSPAASSSGTAAPSRSCRPPARAPPCWSGCRSLPDRRQLAAHEDLVERLALEVGDDGVRSGIADRDQQVAALLAGTVEDLVEEAHRAGRVGQRGQAGHMERGQQEADGDPDRLLDVVGLRRVGALVDLEDRDQRGRLDEERLLGVGAEPRQRLQPLGRRSALVELPLLRLGGRPQTTAHLRVGDDHEPPGLDVGSAGRTGRRAHGLLEDAVGDRTAVEVAHAAPPHEVVGERCHPRPGLVVGQRERRRRRGRTRDRRISAARHRVSVVAELRGPARRRWFRGSLRSHLNHRGALAALAPQPPQASVVEVRRPPGA